MKLLIWLPIGFAILIASCKKDNKTNLAVVNTISATNITASSAQTGGNITNTGGTSITKSGVCWAIHTNPNISDSITSDGTSAGTYTSQLLNLNANTAYYIRAYAINGVGTAYGELDSFITAKGLASLTTLSISNNEALTAQCGGNISNNGGSTIITQGICWSTSHNPTVSNFKTVDDKKGSNIFTDTLSSLILNSTYYVRAYATNSFGTAYGNEVGFTVSSTGTVSDFDGNVYGTITIGTQTWTTSNLRVTHYRNGDPIINGLNGFDLANDTTGAYTFPNADTTLNGSYGKFYNTGAINDNRNIAPLGWHVATDEDWYTLEFFEGLTTSDTSVNSDLGLRGSIGGKLLQGGSSGLNLQLVGYYCPNCGAYAGFSQFGFYMSSTRVPTQVDYYNYGRAFNVTGPGPIDRLYGSEMGGVRLVKD